MSFHVYISHRIPTPDEKAVSIVVWSRVNNLIACSQTNGIISLMQTSVNAERPGDFKLAITSSLVEHKSAITTMAWNERFTRLISGDLSGLFIVWSETSARCRPYLTHTASQMPVTTISASQNSENVAITYSDGIVVCGDFHGNHK
jgi:WD40 repeat protein